MNITVVIRDYFSKINPFFHRLDESIDQNEFLKDFLQSFLFFFETKLFVKYNIIIGIADFVSNIIYRDISEC